MPRNDNVFVEIQRRWSRMPQSNRVWLACLIALTLVIAVLSINYQQQPQRELLLVGQTFTGRELIALEGAFAKSGLSDYEILDNQVQIGHNVQVGSTCMLCAQVGIAGSAVIGDRVVLGGKVGVADHVKIGSDVLVGAASAVASNIPSRNIMMGVPAVKRDEALRNVMAVRRLPRLFETVDALKKRLSALDGDR